VLMIIVVLRSDRIPDLPILLVRDRRTLTHLRNHLHQLRAVAPDHGTHLLKLVRKLQRHINISSKIQRSSYMHESRLE